jgi:hypothetical protein
MKLKIIPKKRRFLSSGFIIGLVFLLCMCVNLDGVDYPLTAMAGETVTFTMHVRIDAIDNITGTRMVIAFLAPKSWKAAQNTTVTYTSKVDEGIQTMSLIPDGTVAKNSNGQTWPVAIRSRLGVGKNVLDDMEWVVYWSDKVYSVSNGEKIPADVKIKTKLGPENMRLKLGFFLNHTGDGFSGDDKHYKVIFSDCFEVSGGEGDLIDFCNLHFNAAQPATATKDDILTFKFQGDVGTNPLYNTTPVYFCAKAYTDNGNVYEVCGRDEKSQMKKESQFGNTYAITLWPGAYFNLPPQEKPLRIEYTFTNADGTVQVKDEIDGSPDPFVYTFKCQ